MGRVVCYSSFNRPEAGEWRTAHARFRAIQVCSKDLASLRQADVQSDRRWRLEKPPMFRMTTGRHLRRANSQGREPADLPVAQPTKFERSPARGSNESLPGEDSTHR